jgi:predicted nucleic acid-binding protein
MELIDIEKERAFFINKIKTGWEINRIISARKQPDLSKELLEDLLATILIFFKKYRFIEIIGLESNKEWFLAVFISSLTNLSAEDALHLATAISTKSNIILTSDSHFKKEGEIFIRKNKLYNDMRICEPNYSKFISTLSELGFKYI